MVILLYGCKTNHKEVIVFPENIKTGIIVYECDCGIEVAPDANGSLVYEFPDNGILLVKNKRQRGAINNEIYKRKNGVLKLLQQEAPGRNRDKINNTVASYTYSVGWGENYTACNKSQKGENDINCVIYTINQYNTDQKDVDVSDKLQKYFFKAQGTEAVNPRKCSELE